MYTGIIQKSFEIVGVNKKEGLSTLEILFESLLDDIQIGASVAIDGTCLTVAKINGNIISFDVMQETLNKTTLGNLKVGDFVNIERSAKQGSEIGGHIMSGHIDGTAEIVDITKTANNYVIKFQCPLEWMKYILSKGFIGINGASLTIVDAKPEGTFEVHLIPETLRTTTFGQKKIGDRVNIELHNETKAIVDTVERYLQQNKIK